MKVLGSHYQTIWEKPDTKDLVLNYINQRRLPFSFDIEETKDYNVLLDAIKDMTLRGAPLIGIAGAYTLCLALQSMKSKNDLIADFEALCSEISNARPTAVNLSWAVEKVKSSLDLSGSLDEIVKQAIDTTRQICSDELERCRLIGEHGKKLLEEISAAKNGEIVNVLTHCNAGWLATLDYGTALAPIYAARSAGINIHVWVDETRPRNQGSKLTAFELLHENIPHTVITDNAGGHLMQHGLVDIVIVGADRVARNGDVCNKIGTYLKALAAFDNSIPFYAAVPSSTFDLSIADGVKDIEIEERNSDEVLFFEGVEKNRFYNVATAPIGTSAKNYGFDVTPARLISGLITENGIILPEVIGIEDV